MAAKREFGENSQGHRHNLASRTVHTPLFDHGQGLLPWEASPRSVCWMQGAVAEEGRAGTGTQSLLLGLVRLHQRPLWLVARVWGHG